MAEIAYQGHWEKSSSKVAGEDPENVAPADRPGYDPADFSDEPGAAARANGYPRQGTSSSS